VGLSLASGFGNIIPTIAFDIDRGRIQELQEGHDSRGEFSPEALRVSHLIVTNDPEALRKADFLIVTVPTPVDRTKRPDLSHLIEASRLIGRILKSRRSKTAPNKPNQPNKPIIVYESTVYPGCTEEVCIPVLEQESGLKAGKDFKVGYSPERINPGDPEHTLETIVKVVAAQDGETAETMAKVYALVVKTDVYKAGGIRTAEAAKVIENIQRDLNVALMNELAMLFHRLGLDIREVLKAARTKWNFLPFEPGLVGGHCIPVDPYYLTYKAQEIGYHPEVILAGRRINDSMGVYVGQETVKLLIKAGKTVCGAKVLVLGATFKEDVRDVRNSRVVDLVRELETYGAEVRVYDPYVDPTALKRLRLTAISDPFRPHKLNKPNQRNITNQLQYDAVILAVPHRAFREKNPTTYLKLLKEKEGPGVVVDVKGVLPLLPEDNTGILYWTL
jgi:UDP-N-acetyl-D-galactosamine dehydrogenase